MQLADQADDEPLAVLIRDYGRLIRSAVARVSGRSDADLGDEIVQRVTTAIWKHLQGAQTIEHPASYLYRCAVRETIRELRRELASDDPELMLSVATADGASPEHGARASELALATETALAAMNPDRALAVRAHLIGYSVDEIMAMYGWNYQKARNAVARGMADLRERLADRGYP
jgi:RNA polymerase sigma factor (sigma-70 family)